MNKREVIVILLIIITMTSFFSIYAFYTQLEYHQDDLLLFIAGATFIATNALCAIISLVWTLIKFKQTP